MTHPGTEIKVTPDREALIIPNATMYQGDCLFPRKKLKLSAFLPVKYDTMSNILKYKAMMMITIDGLILDKLLSFKCKNNKK